MNSLNCLIITTSNGKIPGKTKKTGVWLEALAAPYYILKDGGGYITITSPQGGQIPVDPDSQFPITSTESSSRFQQDPRAMYHLSHSLPFNEVNAEDFDLVFVAGGYGSMWDLVNNKELKQMLEYFNRQKKPVGLVGHGVVAIVSLTKDNGESLVKGRKLTSFSNSEEKSAQLNGEPDFYLQSKLISLGALYSKGPDFASYVVLDDNIITGQNPASSGETARQLLAMAHKKTEMKKLKDYVRSIQRNIS
jgi:putative intracellular protease/amidase